MFAKLAALDKKYLYVGGGVCFFVFLFVLLFALSQPAAPLIQSDISVGVSPTGSLSNPATNPTSSPKEPLRPTPLPDPLVQATKQFYSWYFSLTDPLATGEYKNSPYLSNQFKQDIAGMYNPAKPQADPMFCTKNKTTNFRVGEPIYTSSASQATVYILQNTTEGKPIYRFVYAKTGGSWLINDIICVP